MFVLYGAWLLYIFRKDRESQVSMVCYYPEDDDVAYYMFFVCWCFTELKNWLASIVGAVLPGTRRIRGNSFCLS